MTSEIKTFEFNLNPVRGLLLGGAPWFVATDVARLLIFLTVQEAVTRFCPNASRLAQRLTDGEHVFTIIPLRDLEVLVDHSHLPNKLDFLEWVRKTMVPGLYPARPWVTEDPDPSCAAAPATGQVRAGLITIQAARIAGTEVNAVNGRDLHAFLEVGKHFGSWITEQIEAFGFLENQDFEVIPEFGKNPQGGRPTKEYMVSLSMAKELAMVQRSEKGKQARLYFIECERQALLGANRAPQVPRTLPEALRAYANALDQKLELECKVQVQQGTIQLMEPKAAFHDAVASAASSSICVTEMAKLLGTGGVRFFRWLREERIFMREGRQENLPFQRYIDEGYFEVREGVNEDTRTGEPHSFRQALVTGKGQVWLQKRFTKQVPA